MRDTLIATDDSVFKRGDLIQVYEPYEGYTIGDYVGLLGLVVHTYEKNVAIYLQTGECRIFSSNYVFLVQHSQQALNVG